MSKRKQAPLTEPVRQFLTSLAAKSGPKPELLPSEMALAQRFGVSRPTVRLAIEELLASGVVQRLDGRRGLFSCPRNSQFSAGYSIAVTAGTGRCALGDQSLLAIEASFQDEICYRTSHLEFIDLASGEAPAENLRRRGFDALLWLGPDESRNADADALIEAGFPVVFLPSAYAIPQNMPVSNVIRRDFISAGRRRAARLLDGGSRNIAFIAADNDAMAGVRMEYAARGLAFRPAHLLSGTEGLGERLTHLLDQEVIDCIASDGGPQRYEEILPAIAAHPRGRSIEIHLSYGEYEQHYHDRYPELDIRLNSRNYNHAVFRKIGKLAARNMLDMLTHNRPRFQSISIDC